MEIPLNGNIKDISLVKILIQLNQLRKTGILTVFPSTGKKKIYMSMGNVIFASSGNADDRLGEMLLKAGKITVEQYDKSAERLKSTGKKQGAILVELGYLTPKEIFWGLKYQVNEIVQNMFLLEDAEYDFREGELPGQEVIALKVSMGDLIYTGINRIANWTRIRNEMPDTNSVLQLRENPLSLAHDISLNSQDKKILSLIDGKKTMKEIIDGSWLGSFEALRILYILWTIGMIEQTTPKEAGEHVRTAGPPEETASPEDVLKSLSEEEALLANINAFYAQVENMSLNELLQVDEKADSETIKKNYRRLAREYHPDRHLSFSTPDTRMKLARIFDALTKAYKTLGDDKRKAEYYQSFTTPHKAKEPAEVNKAEDQFQAGIAAFKQGNFWSAIDNFKWAIRLQPDSAKYLSSLSLAYSKVPGKLKEAEDVLQQAIKLDPFNADLHANLGLIYSKAGLKKRAQNSFLKALKIAPQHDKAKKGLEEINRKSGQS